MSNQTKFKVNDKVVRKQGTIRSLIWDEFLKVHGARDYYTVTSTRGGRLKLEGYKTSSFDAEYFELYSENVIPDSWDYAEAARLEQAAKDAIKAYNEYVQRQPKKVYLPMYLPD